MSEREIIIEIDMDELATRIAEACMGVKRRAGQNGANALREINQAEPGMGDSFRKGARVAAEYCVECFSKRSRVQ